MDTLAPDHTPIANLKFFGPARYTLGPQRFTEVGLGFWAAAVGLLAALMVLWIPIL